MKKLVFFLISLLIVISALGCKLPFVPTLSALSDVKICDNLENKEVCSESVSVFSTDTAEIFVTAKLKNVDPDTDIHIEWWYKTSNYQIDEATVASGNNVRFNLAKPINNGWPAGDYELRVFLNEEEPEVIGFKVE